MCSTSDQSAFHGALLATNGEDKLIIHSVVKKAGWADAVVSTFQRLCKKDLELATPAAVLEITHRGKFLKRGRLHNTYRRRYMVLENGVLRYFKERDTKVCP